MQRSRFRVDRLLRRCGAKRSPSEATHTTTDWVDGAGGAPTLWSEAEPRAQRASTPLLGKVVGLRGFPTLWSEAERDRERSEHTPQRLEWTVDRLLRRCGAKRSQRAKRVTPQRTGWTERAVLRRCGAKRSGRSNERSVRTANVVGLAGVEPATSPLSGVRSNQLSYRPSNF